MIAVGKGTGPDRTFGLSFTYQCHSSRTHGDETLTARFFSREVRIIYHREGVARCVWYGGLVEGRIYFSWFERGSSCNMLAGCFIGRQYRYPANLNRVVDR